MDFVISVLMLLLAAGSFLISLLEFIRQLIQDMINKK
ncbi:putative holin-like toxin [Ornithinibacillus contaminans]|nr:putative holin-like toxin [Ornithinibacillus contaminans]